MIKKIFLASSKELESDRKEFEIFIGRRNKSLVRRELFLELVVWEDFLDALSKTRLQDEYNNAIRACDVFVMLFWTKVGTYTQEEFETAVGQFKATDRPVVFTYFKHAEFRTGSVDEQDLLSLLAFKKKLSALGHFWTSYNNIDDLKVKFSEQLDKLGFDEFKPHKPIGPASLRSKTLTSKAKLGAEIPTLLHTFLGLDPEAIPLSGVAAPENRNHVFRLWADSEYENSISATLAKSDNVDLIRIRFTNQSGSLPGDVTLRPLGLKAIAVPKDQHFLVFDVRAPREGLRNAENEQANKALAIAVRIIDARATQWCYQARDTRRCFTIEISDSWTSVYMDLRDGWVRFEADGNYYYAADRPDFSVIAAIVIEVGTVGAPRPGSGTGELEICRFRMSQDGPVSGRPAKQC
ncbi:MAG: hypothetical protein H8K03_06740 [Nitrospira sp.]